MRSAPPLLSLLLMVVSGWVHRHQLIVIDFLQAENRLLKEKLGGKRIRFTDAERALLARRAKAVGRKALLQLDTIVSPDTPAVASAIGGAEMELRPPTRTWSAEDHARDLGVDRPDGA